MLLVSCSTYFTRLKKIITQRINFKWQMDKEVFNFIKYFLVPSLPYQHKCYFTFSNCAGRYILACFYISVTSLLLLTVTGKGAIVYLPPAHQCFHPSEWRCPDRWWQWPCHWRCLHTTNTHVSSRFKQITKSFNHISINSYWMSHVWPSTNYTVI